MQMLRCIYFIYKCRAQLDFFFYIYFIYFFILKESGKNKMLQVRFKLSALRMSTKLNNNGSDKMSLKL